MEKKDNHSPFITLRFRNFRLVWIGLFISSIGSMMQVTAINWHIYLLTKSALSLAMIGLVKIVPIILLAPFTGVLADIHNRRKLILVAQTIMTVCAISLTILTYLNIINPLMIYVIIFINAIAMAIDIPARQSFMPLLLPEKYFANASSLINVMWRLSAIIGPGIGGLMIAGFNIGSVYLFNAISFLAIIFVLLEIGSVNQIYSNRKLSLFSIKEGFSFVFKSPLICSTMFLDFFATFFASGNVLLPIFAKDILKVGAQGYGFLSAASAIGGAAAGICLSFMEKIRHQGRLILVAVIVYGLATLFFGLSKLFFLSFVFLAITGFADVISSTIRNTIRQLNTPDYIRGRMSSVSMIFFYGGPELGEVEAGVMASFIGAPISVVIGGVGAIISTLIIGLVTPKLTNYDQ
ncbi:MFS transporter [Candidatus Roizmanbacteria bacterium]|nr:MFS transporter [Candidatus Roizmanbacteria bacterium]